MAGVLIAHRGAQRISREDLMHVPTPVGTDTWKPVAHHTVIETLEAELHRRSMTVSREQYAVQRDGALLFGVLDLAYLESKETVASIGLRTANDRTMSLQIACGMRVLVCDNMCFSGDLIALRRKHTKHLDINKEVHGAIDRYLTGVAALHGDVDRLRNTYLTDEQAKIIIYEAFQQEILSPRYFGQVARGYFGLDQSRSLFGLHNAFTACLREVPPGPSFTATVKLGKLFGLTQRDRALALPAGLGPARHG